MPFIQFKIDKSFNQSRGIFDVYAYETDDTKSEVLAPGYFNEVRFASDPKWVGSQIEVSTSDGYMRVEVISPGSVSLLLEGGLTEGRVNELISNYGIWEIEDSFTSIDQQDAIEDVISPIDFGGTKTSPNGLVFYDDSDKTFSILKSGPFLVKTRTRLARVGASNGVSEVFLQAQVSVDNGVTWINNGNPVDVKLQNTDEVEIFFDFSAIYFPSGVKLRQTFARSSVGTNFGSAIPGVPSVPLQNLGLTESPSAQVTVYRLRDFNYT